MTVNATVLHQLALGLNSAAFALQSQPAAGRNIVEALQHFKSWTSISWLDEPLRNDVGPLVRLFSPQEQHNQSRQGRDALKTSIINVLRTGLSVFQGPELEDDIGEIAAIAVKESIRLLWEAGTQLTIPGHLAEHVVNVIDGRSPGDDVLLYVDDMIILHRALIRGMTPLGYDEILVASNGAEGLKLAELNLDRLTAVVTDFNMPLMNGAELVRRLHQQRPDLPVLVITGRDENSITQDHRAWMVLKPILARQIAKHLRLMMILRQAYAG